MDLKGLKAEIESLKSELDRLIDLGANFNDIYKISVKLDKLIVILYRSVAAGSF